ncbi:MAG: hypothetical protein ACRDRX_08445 [Pseudonocardiaceae bacterium]
MLAVSELASNWCEPECEREITYCLECIGVANEWNYDAGVEVDCSPGIRAVSGR